MHIICPHCTTSYAIDLQTLGVAGRTVRCSRCREVWLARPQDVRTTHALVPSMAEHDPPPRNFTAPAVRNEPAPSVAAQAEATPVVESPPISAEWPEGEEARDTDMAPVDAPPTAPAIARPRRRLKPSFSLARPRIGLGTV